jgi:hypothetical protein
MKGVLERVKQQTFLCMILISFFLLFSGKSAFSASDKITHPNVPKSFSAEDSALKLYGAVQKVLVALETNSEFKDTRTHPEQLGELLVRSNFALSVIRNILAEAESGPPGDESAVYLEAFKSAEQGMNSLYSYLVGFVDGSPKERLWTDYMTHIGRYLDLTRQINSNRDVDQLEKGLLFDTLAQLRTIITPAIDANSLFLTLFEEERLSQQLFLSSVEARDNTNYALANLNKFHFPAEIGNFAFKELVRCSSLYRSYAIYMLRVLDTYEKTIEQGDEKRKREISELLKESRSFSYEAECIIRTLKGSY